jgi:tyrosyl-tRNA synthetase
MAVSTATNVLDELKQRGFVAQVSDEPALRRALESGPITLYQGFDPTATSLHTGNLVGIMALAHFQRAGHRPIAVVGGGTGLVGDPAGHDKDRAVLTLDQVDRNVAGIRQQFAKYIDFGSGKALMVNNADWLRPLNYLEFLRNVGRHFTVNQLMQHGTYWERFEQGTFPFIELNYALVQAYDFLHLYREHNCILQIGGNDQWFNILAGRDLIRRADSGEAFALTTPLIETSSGQKMSKSAGNAPWLDPALTTPYDYYQYWRNVEDGDVGRFLRLFTFLSLDEIAELERLSGADINRAKEVLAFEATRLTHGEEEALRAQETARARFGGEGVDLGPSLTVAEPTRVTQVLVSSGLASSLGEARRKIAEGGVRLAGVKVESHERLIDPSELPALISLGKRKVRLEAG